jgi:hypothetical protein
MQASTLKPSEPPATLLTDLCLLVLAFAIGDDEPEPSEVIDDISQTF